MLPSLPDQLLFYASYALQALVPFRVLIAIAMGATAYWLVPVTARRYALIAISLGIVLFGYQRPPLLPIIDGLVCALVYVAVCRGVSNRVIIPGLVLLYGLAHLAFGLITFTSVLSFTGLTTDYVLPTLGLTAAFTLLRLVHFAVDFGGRSSPVHREKSGAGPGATRPHPITFAAWCLFFPTFVHLPLIRYQAWAQQFEGLSASIHGLPLVGTGLPKRPTLSMLGKGVLRIGQGIVKGVLLGIVYVTLNFNAVLLSPAGHTLLELLGATLVSAITYYIGFSAYMDIGIGAASLFGITLPENFAPMLKMLRISRMRDFWRNWNITTTQWLNDYVYKPLGGWRKHPIRNTLLTMTACGLWHSVSLFGAAWGMGLGLLLIVEHGYNKLRIKRDWPDVPPLVRASLVLGGVALVNLALTPYGYTAQTARLLYPLYWLHVAT